jgi:hypothetical protein
MFQSMLHVPVHAACPCGCCMSMLMLHIHVHAAWTCWTNMNLKIYFKMKICNSKFEWTWNRKWTWKRTRAWT